MVARLCPGGAFSDVMAYTPQVFALRGMVDKLLAAASYDSRWVSLTASSLHRPHLHPILAPGPRLDRYDQRTQKFL